MRLLTAFILVAAIFGGTACSKKKKDTIAHIYVLDEGSNAVEGATVILYGQATGIPIGSNTPGLVNLNDTAVTNESGLAVFNLSDRYQLGQAGVAILNIKAIKFNKSGNGTIKIIPEETCDQTITIQP